MLAITGGTIHTIASGRMENAAVLISGGKILAVGCNLPIPHDAEIVAAYGKVILPGLIDCHTHLGIAEEAVGQAHVDKNEVNDPVCPHLRALDGINPEDLGLADALNGGVTSIIVTPGSENVIGGQSVAIKTRGRFIDEMILRQPAGIKIAFGENPINTYMQKDRVPSTRMTIAGLLRENFVAAETYARKLSAGQVERNLRLEALVKVLNKEVPIRAHAHEADDIMTAVRIADEFDVKLVIEHATSGHKIADQLAKRDIPAAIGPSITARVKVELKDRTPYLLHEAGVKFALVTDHPFLPINCLRLEAALAVREGLPYDIALRAITLTAAEIIGVEDRIGSIEPGKAADLAVFSGDPLDVQTKVEQVYVDGNLVS